MSTPPLTPEQQIEKLRSIILDLLREMNADKARINQLEAILFPDPETPPCTN